jgi:hypothetical protein
LLAVCGWRAAGEIQKKVDETAIGTTACVVCTKSPVELLVCCTVINMVEMANQVSIFLGFF